MWRERERSDQLTASQTLMHRDTDASVCFIALGNSVKFAKAITVWHK